MWTFVGQFLTCVLLAAGIGVVVGWLLNTLATLEKRQQVSEIAARLRGREHEMDSLHHEVKVKTSAVQILEGKMIAAEATIKDLQTDLGMKNERIGTLQTELAVKDGRLDTLEHDLSRATERLTEIETALAEKTEAYQDSEAELDMVREALLDRDREISTLKTSVADHDALQSEIHRLQTIIGELEPLREETEQLRTRLKSEQGRAQADLAGRDEQIVELRNAVHQLQQDVAQAKQTARQEEHRHRQLLLEKDNELTRLQTQVKEFDTLKARLQKARQDCHSLETRHEVILGERDEEIAELRRRLVEFRTAQRLGAKVSAAGSEGATPRSKSKAKPANNGPVRKDDLKKIRGIGPALERTLNRNGTHTFIQIARWERLDIERIAEQLETVPNRIIRDKWVAGAKKQHFLKYGERI